jgi:hypothetical protein
MLQDRRRNTVMSIGITSYDMVDFNSATQVVTMPEIESKFPIEDLNQGPPLCLRNDSVGQSSIL